MSSVQKLGVPVLLCTITAIHGSLNRQGKGEPLLDSRSNPNRIQAMLIAYDSLKKKTFIS